MSTIDFVSEIEKRNIGNLFLTIRFVTKIEKRTQLVRFVQFVLLQIKNRIVDLNMDQGATVLTLFMVIPRNKLPLNVAINDKIWQVIFHAMSAVFFL